MLKEQSPVIACDINAKNLSGPSQFAFAPNDNLLSQVKKWDILS